MQQILELFEVTSNKVAIEQLSGEPLKEIFATDYQKYYGQDCYAYNAKDYAQVNKRSYITLIGDDDISANYV
jgi:hypothetical protein